MIETSSIKSVETKWIDLWGEMTMAMVRYVSLFLGVKEVKGEAKSSSQQME